MSSNAASEAPSSAVQAPTTILRAFHPGWYGAVMGTAIVGVGAYLNPGSSSNLLTAAHDIGVAFVIAAWVIAFMLVGPYLSRLVAHRDQALADLRNPAIGPLYATFPAALLVLAVATATAGPTIFTSSTPITDIVTVLAIAGGLLTVAFSVVFTYILFTSERVDTQLANGAWFIPPVANIVIPLALIPLLSHVGPTPARLLMLAGYAGFGAGLLLFLMLSIVVFARLVFHPLPQSALAPTLWIGLGPIGVGSIALLHLAAAGVHLWGPAAPAVQLLSLIAASALWGLGVWWLFTAAALLIRYLLRGGLPFGVGLWGFTFPLGAYTVATLAIATAWHTQPLAWGAAGLLIVLAGFWLVVAGCTLQAMVTGKAWQR
ncbi:MAG: hypothetical protein ACP5H2_06015 [Solirubrobacteraceae bacterium]